MPRKSNNPNHMKNLKPLAKGYDPRRNLKGVPPKLPQLDVLLAKVLGTEDKDGITGAERILAALHLKAEKGDHRCAEILMDRGFGKVKQPIEQSGDVAVNQTITHQVVINRQIIAPGQVDESDGN